MTSLWNDRVLPWAVDVALADVRSRPWRERVCAGVSGEVLELGLGSGLNLPHYGPGVTRVLGVEPSARAWDRSSRRRTTFGRPVELVGVDGADLALADTSVDAVVSTWVLCTIPEVERALRECARVLRPGGALHFVEHVRSGRPRLAAVQRSVQPLWGRIAGGCHLDRDIVGLVEAAGFVVDLDPSRGEPVALAPFVSGRATPLPD